MSAEHYVASYEYESFIKLARDCNTDEFGAHNSLMLNLIYKDLNDSCVNHLKKDNVIADVKKYMTSATKFAIARNLDNADKVIFTSFIDRIEASQTSDELLTICTEGIEILLKYKPV